MKVLPVFLTAFLLMAPAQAKYSGGMGEPNNPYQIATAEDLMLLGESPEDYDKHFIMTADIDLDPNLPGRKVFEKAVIAPDTNDVKSGFQGTSFRGVFDGNGHAISHLTIEGGSYLGLFGRMQSDAEVKDLRVVDVNITSSGYCVGGLVGYNDGGAGGAVTRCYSTGAVSGRVRVGGLVGINYGSITTSYSTGAVSGDDSIGGLIGDNRGGSITTSYSTGTVSGDEDVGGLVGYNTGSITTSYSTGTVRGGDRVGGLLGYDLGGRISDCYSTKNVSGQERVGGMVGKKLSGTITNCYSVGRVTGKTRVGGLIGILYEGNVYSSFWDIEASGQMISDGGTGKTTAEMQDSKSLMDAGWDFVGAPDGPSNIWTEPADGGYPILWWQLSPLPALPTFSGGTGTVYDPYLISIGDELNSVGYNPRLMGAHFKLIDDIDLTGIDFFIIGNLSYPFTGVFDGNGHAISNFTCISTDANNVALFGFVEGENAEIKNLGLIDPNIDAGTGRRVGSLVGWLIYGTITNCYIEGGSVSREDSIGGMVGRNSGTIIDSYITTSVSGDYSVGGIAGYNSGTIINCYANGSVMGNGYVGGMVGYNLGTITNCCANSVVIGNKNVGGMVGRHGRYDSYHWFPDLERMDKISNCYSTSNVSGGDRIGGFVGERTSGSIITSCYSAGSVSGNDDVGGLVGAILSLPRIVPWGITLDTISDFYSTADITDNGGFVMVDIGARTMSSFWDIETSGQHTSARGVGKTTAEMQTASTFLNAGWDFVGETENGTEDIWWILEGQDYPRLIWELPEGLELRPLPAFSPNPRNGAIDVTQSPILHWAPAEPTLQHDIYLSEDKEEVANATTFNLGIYRGRQPGELTTYDPGKLKWDTTYYWRIDVVNEAEPNNLCKGSVWGFTTANFPLPAFSPNPRDGAINVTQSPILHWAPAEPAIQHDIYFGEDKEVVANATTLNLGIYRGRQPGELATYDPGKLEWGATYYWRIDEVNEADPNNLCKGSVWGFTTANFLIVDDFGSYNNLVPSDPKSNRIFDTWIDVLETTTIRVDFLSLSGFFYPTFLRYEYDNSSPPYYSEATADIDNLAIGQDWTQDGVGVLSLGFYGYGSNVAEPMYVALANANGPTAVVYHDNPDAATINTPTGWAIDLQMFADQGVDLTNINTISIGFGDRNNPQPGGSGVMYFDDIRLYRSSWPKWPVPIEPELPPTWPWPVPIEPLPF